MSVRSGWFWHGSLPVRERGLKLFPAASWQPPCGSLPVRERGLKQARLAAEAGVVVVAPRAGATYVDLYYHGHNPDISQQLEPAFLIYLLLCFEDVLRNI